MEPVKGHGLCPIFWNRYAFQQPFRFGKLVRARETGGIRELSLSVRR